MINIPIRYLYLNCIIMKSSFGQLCKMIKRYMKEKSIQFQQNQIQKKYFRVFNCGLFGLVIRVIFLALS